MYYFAHIAIDVCIFRKDFLCTGSLMYVIRVYCIRLSGARVAIRRGMLCGVMSMGDACCVLRLVQALMRGGMV